MSSDAASTYSTGGGGVVLEHQYTAALLAALLVGEPVAELGDRVALTVVRLQASDVSSVDDLVLEGRSPTGETHRASIGVRRDPKLTTGDEKSVPLVRSYLELVTEHWAEIAAGRWSLILAVAKTRSTFVQVNALAELARAVPDAPAFAEAVARPAAMDEATRGRLSHVRALVAKACDGVEALLAFDIDELTWRWLSALTVRVLHLEGADTSDRTAAVAALQRSVRGGTHEAADTVFSSLSELASRYASKGARVTRGMLRRELATHPLKRVGTHEAQWTVFDRLEQQLRDQTRSTISTGRAMSGSVQIDRADAALALRNALQGIAKAGGGLVITGEPDVGKSALTLRTCDELRALGMVVVVLSLRDLPEHVLDLEQALVGVSLDELFAGAATASTRILVVDGCEAVLEGKRPQFTALATAATRSGFGVAGVTRSDGAQSVQVALRDALETTGRDEVDRSSTVREHVVDALPAEQRAELAAEVGALARLQDDSRAAWLLGRPGLVDALLRSSVSLDPAQLLSEADVYVAVWNGLVRRNEETLPGAASPHDRDATAVNLARRRLGGAHPFDGKALSGLRSDGVLRKESNPAFSSGPEFSSDLYRDFALCRLFLESDWQPLTDAGTPRWTIRAARLACQVRLLRDREGRARTWAELTAEFESLAVADGKRWTEVPYEALLTLGDAPTAIAELWDALTQGEGLSTLLRLAGDRHASGGVGNVYSLAPIVEVAFCDKRPLGSGVRGASRSIREQLNELVLVWLRGSINERSPSRLRQRVRDTLLEQDRPLYDEFAVEALATLGPDLDARTEAWLRRVALEHPWSVYEVVEPPFTVLSLAAHCPNLLLDLSEAYYIERPDEDSGHRNNSPFNEGIRDTRHGHELSLGWAQPQAAWYYGPFFQLLNAVPVEAIAFVNRMLDHAARHRVTGGAPWDNDSTQADWVELEGTTLDLSPATGSRHYVGDASVWCWYRGTSVGSYACMSALLALEKFADHLITNLQIPVLSVIDLLLQNCHNLAVPGMLAGLLIRHLDNAGSLLDAYLANADVWHYEFARTGAERGLRVRDASADTLPGSERRQMLLHDVVGRLVIRAHEDGDTQRLSELERVGEQLIEFSLAKAVNGSSGAPGVRSSADPAENEAYDFALVKSWADEFHFGNYAQVTVNGERAYQYQQAPEVAAVLAPNAADLQMMAALYDLQHRYAMYNDHPDQWPVNTLSEDIATARLLEDMASDEVWRRDDALCAVAAATIRAHVAGAAEIALDNLTWASGAVLNAALNPRIDDLSHSSSMYHMAADRAAAIAVPLLLLEPCDGLSLAPAMVHDALRASATSVFDEVRMLFALGCEPVWEAHCENDYDGVCRRHAQAWDVVEEELSNCVRGPWSMLEGRYLPGVLQSPYTETLPAARDKDLRIDRLRMPVICHVGARKAACLGEAVRVLSGPLWDAHRRGLDHWWREPGSGHQDRTHHEPIARVLIEAAVREDRVVLDEHLRTFASNAPALQRFMDSFSAIFTYDDELQASLAGVWVPMLDTVLDAIDDGANLRGERGSWFDWAVASLLPTPQVAPADPDVDATLARCKERWLDPDELADLFPRWAVLAKGEPRAADALAKLALAAPRSWQATTGLDWLEVIFDGRPADFSNRVRFVTIWLGELRAADLGQGVEATAFRRIVDGLAAGGDSRAVSLQQLDE